MLLLNYFFSNEQWFLLQDNDPKHTSGIVKNWLHNNGVCVLDFPSYSPDLNCIENLWIDLQRRVETHNAKTIEQLQDAIAIEWNATPIEFLVSLSHSMPKRCGDVIAAKGDHIHY